MRYQRVRPLQRYSINIDVEWRTGITTVTTNR